VVPGLMIASGMVEETGIATALGLASILTGPH
jgi:hypothetical protein